MKEHNMDTPDRIDVKQFDSQRKAVNARVKHLGLILGLDCSYEDITFEVKDDTVYRYSLYEQVVLPVNHDLDSQIIQYHWLAKRQLEEQKPAVENAIIAVNALNEMLYGDQLKRFLEFVNKEDFGEIAQCKPTREIAIKRILEG